MTHDNTPGPGNFELFAVCAPGLEAVLEGELDRLGLGPGRPSQGGVSFSADGAGLVRANLWLRSATRVLVRLASFRATHLSELHRQCRRLPWAQTLAPDGPIRIRATCRKSKIYHSRAAAERVEGAIASALPGAVIASGRASGATETEQEILVRLDRDRCTISQDSSGAPLYQRGHKKEVTGAPLRESLAAGLLLACAYDGSAALLDPMCGSGTFPLEAASIACRAAPGAARSFAFSGWPGFPPDLLTRARSQAEAGRLASPPAPILAGDRAGGAVGVSGRNLDRAGYAQAVRVERRTVDRWEPPAERGLLICNPPYGGRLGRGSDLPGLYAAIGKVYRQRFAGWQLAVLTSEPRLAEAVGVDFGRPFGPLAHGGLRVRLYRAGPA